MKSIGNDGSSFNNGYGLDDVMLGGASQGGLENLSAGHGSLMESPEGEKYLRAAALWEALKHKLNVPAPHRIIKRNTHS